MLWSTRDVGVLAAGASATASAGASAGGPGTAADPKKGTGGTYFARFLKEYCDETRAALFSLEAGEMCFEAYARGSGGFMLNGLGRLLPEEGTLLALRRKNSLDGA